MSKSVTWSTCNRLSCSSSESPEVIVCLTDTDLVAEPECTGIGSETFPISTIDAVLTKSWRDCSASCNPCYKYLLAYDENDLVDPTTPLTSAQISGVFCKGCLTDWVEEKVGQEITLVDNGDGTLTLTTQHGCIYTFNGSFPVT